MSGGARRKREREREREKERERERILDQRSRELRVSPYRNPPIASMHYSYTN
jgi:hypothetical protein